MKKSEQIFIIECSDIVPFLTSNISLEVRTFLLHWLILKIKDQLPKSDMKIVNMKVVRQNYHGAYATILLSVLSENRRKAYLYADKVEGILKEIVQNTEVSKILNFALESKDLVDRDVLEYKSYDKN